MSLQDNTRFLSMTVLMTPDMANLSGNVHGGAILKLLDPVAYGSAGRDSGQYLVALSVDQVTFKQPIHVGELVAFLATINHVGRTSMEVGIKVVAENIHTRVSRHTNSCYFSMVAVDGQGRPVEIPGFEPANEEERARFAKAVRRKALRRALAEETLLTDV